MPSLFSRPTGTPHKTKPFKYDSASATGPTSPGLTAPGFKVVKGYKHDVGEFGMVPPPNGTQLQVSGSRTLPNSPGNANLMTPPQTPVHRARPSPYLISAEGLVSPTAPAIPTKYTFLSTYVPPDPLSPNSIDTLSYDSVLRPYGLLGGIGSKAVLGLEDLAWIVSEVGGELEKRALATPMLFSNQALELNPIRVKALIQNCMKAIAVRSEALSNHRTPVEQEFMQDVRFAKDHELAWLYRWAFSRVFRIREGTREVCRGILEWELYEEWRGRERAADYPEDAFLSLSSMVTPVLFTPIIAPLFHLLSRFAAHSHLSGLTPHSLASLFAPLLINIPTSSPATTSHATFVRAASATEHLLLAYIRSSGSPTALGTSDLPSRLRSWVAGYPSMVATDADFAFGSPRRGAKVVRCERVTRTVRAYSKDLVVGAELWAADIPPDTKWEAWDRVVLKHRRGDAGRPKFTSSYRRKMGVREKLPLPASAGESSILSGTSSFDYGKAQIPKLHDDRSPQERDRRAMGKGTDNGEGDEARWGSLAGKEWSMFEEGGFGGGSSIDVGDFGERRDNMRERLQFDMTEGAKTSITAKRQTMDWSEFASSSGGFTRTDASLAISLGLSEPVATSISSWPQERDALQKKLHRSQKETVPFGYDTTPRVGVVAGFGLAEQTILGGIATGSGKAASNASRQERYDGADDHGRIWLEEAFVDCWVDLMLGCGWADREELTFKEANWAIIGYKARPRESSGTPANHGNDPMSDPRTAGMYFLFEERVPLEYQMAIANPQQKRSFATLFSPKLRGKTKKSTTELQLSEQLHGSRSPLRRPEGSGSDFERMLHKSQTKRITLSGDHSKDTTTPIWSSRGKHVSDASAFETPLKSKSSTMQSRSCVSPITPLPSNSKRNYPISQPSSAARVESASNGGDANAREDHREFAEEATAQYATRPDVPENKSSFFSKSKIIRRVKTNEKIQDGQSQPTSRGTAHEPVVFEIRAASGISSAETSPDEDNAPRSGRRVRSKGGREDEKWMDILISNGARQMHRQDTPPIGQARPSDPTGPLPPCSSELPPPIRPRWLDLRTSAPKTPDRRNPPQHTSDDVSAYGKSAVDESEARRYARYHQMQLQTPQHRAQVGKLHPYPTPEICYETEYSGASSTAADSPQATPLVMRRDEYERQNGNDHGPDDRYSDLGQDDHDYTHRYGTDRHHGNSLDRRDGLYFTPQSRFYDPLPDDKERREDEGLLAGERLDATYSYENESEGELAASRVQATRESPPDRAPTQTAHIPSPRDVIGKREPAESHIHKQGPARHAPHENCPSPPIIRRAMTALPPLGAPLDDHHHHRSQGIISPTPRHAGRDTIHRIVEHYGNRADTPEEERESEGGPDDCIASSSATTSPTTSAFHPVPAEKTTSSRTPRAMQLAGPTSLSPPAPVFDLTPGREPSPARYQHGAPLPFVGEEEEEDPYETF